MRSVEASCHALRRCLPPSTNCAAYKRLVSSTRHGPSQLSIFHLALEPFTARDGARYWLRIAISAYPLHSTPLLGGSPSEYLHAVWYEKKLEWCGYPTVKKIEDIFIRLDRIHERDGRTDRYTGKHRMTARPRLHSIARQKSNDASVASVNLSEHVLGLHLHDTLNKSLELGLS